MQRWQGGNDRVQLAVDLACGPQCGTVELPRPLSEPPLHVPETGPDAVPAELPVLAEIPP